LFQEAKAPLGLVVCCTCRIAERVDQPLHLTPAAKADDIAAIARLAGTASGFARGILAKNRHELSSKVSSGPVDKKGWHSDRSLHADTGQIPEPAALARRGWHLMGKWGERIIHHDGSAPARLASAAVAWHGAGMTEPKKTSPRSGGAFLALALLAGAGIGVALGQPTMGLIGGFAVGILIALLVWLTDAKR